MPFCVEDVPTVVVSDFGRDAALRFCTTLAKRELATITRRLPAGAPFFDEYRRIALRLVGELRFIKAPWISVYEDSGRSFDDGILVGFAGGLSTDDVVARIGSVVIEALAGPAARGHARAIVALPCNTLAPISWALRDAFCRWGDLEKLVAASGYVPPGLDRVAEGLVGPDKVLFPTVPEAVMLKVSGDGARVVLPLGTPGIVQVYGRAGRECGASATVVAPEPSWQSDVLEAIQASIANDATRRAKSESALRAVEKAARSRWGDTLVVVEACTDLDYGVGLDSGELYAHHVVQQVYGP